MEKENTTAGKTVLQKFLDDFTSDGHKREVTLNRALTEIQSERIRRGWPIYNFIQGLKLSSDKELKEMENQVREELFGHGSKKTLKS